jgi:hypothetical protein
MTAVLASNVPRSRTISTTAPLQGGGNLGADRTISLVTEAVDLIYATMPAFSVKREGGDPTGVADSSAAVQSCIDQAAAAGGGIVVFGPGIWKFANCLIEPGVFFKGAGTSHAPNDGVSATKWQLASTAAGACFLRLSPNCGEYFDGGGTHGIEFDGTLYGGVSDIPSAPTTTVEVDKVRGIDLRQGPLKTISSEDTSAETITTSTAHGFSTGDVVAFSVGSGGTLPTSTGTVIAAQPSYFYVNVTSPTTVMVYNTKANAVAGGATGKANITVAGSGTRYVYRTVAGIYHFAIENCYFHNLDEAFRGSCIVDRTYAVYTMFKYCYVGFQGQEHPRFINSRFQHCVFGLTGRFVDMILNGSNQFSSCYYGIAPYDPVGAGSSSYLGNNGATYFINGCTISGEFFVNVVAITIGSNNIVTPETFVVGSPTDTGTLLHSTSIGIRIQGNENHIAGARFGEGTAATSFAKAAILLDRNGNGGESANNLIDGCGFSLVSAVSGNAAIAGGDTNLATPLIGSGNFGAIAKFAIRNCKAKLGNMRFFYAAPGNGSVQYSELVDNSVTIYSGGSNTMGASAGVMEAPFYNGCDITNNRIYNVSGTAGSAIKQSANLVMTNTRVIDNRFDGTFSVAPVDNTTGTPSGCTYRTNGGTSPYVSENSGTATFSSGATTLVVSHGLAQTPLIHNINLTPQSNLTANGAYWISTITSTQFTINLATGSGTPAFSWQARLAAA